MVDLTRISCDEIRHRVLKHIRESPGSTAEMISNITGISVERVRSAMAQLLTIKEITKEQCLI